MRALGDLRLLAVRTVQDVPADASEGREPSLCGVNTQGCCSSNLHPSGDRLAGSSDSKGPVRGFAYLNT